MKKMPSISQLDGITITGTLAYASEPYASIPLPPFSDKDFSQMLRQGWYIGRQGRICPTSCINGKSSFKTEDEALAYVKKRAIEGSEFHERVLAWIAAVRITR